MRKVVKKGSIIEDRIYIGNYEIYRKTTSGTLNVERETLHIADDKQRIAQIDSDITTTTTRYQLSDHLGSASVELDENADIISYEEYYPFGSTSYRNGRNEVDVSLKRYKYVMKELDNETGLYYYGARYYASWLGRFIAIDPKQHSYQHLTPYNYVANSPLNNTDPDGMDIIPTSDEAGNKTKEAIDRILIYDEISNLFQYESYGEIRTETRNDIEYKGAGKIKTASKKEFRKTLIENQKKIDGLKLTDREKEDITTLTYAFYIASNLEEPVLIDFKKEYDVNSIVALQQIGPDYNRGVFAIDVFESGNAAEAGRQEIILPLDDASGAKSTIINNYNSGKEESFSRPRYKGKVVETTIDFTETKDRDEYFVHELLGEYIGSVKYKRGEEYPRRGRSIEPIQIQNVYRRLHKQGWRTGIMHGSHDKNQNEIPRYFKLKF